MMSLYFILFTIEGMDACINDTFLSIMFNIAIYLFSCEEYLLYL